MGLLKKLIKKKKVAKFKEEKNKQLEEKEKFNNMPTSSEDIYPKNENDTTSTEIDANQKLREAICNA